MSGRAVKQPRKPALQPKTYPPGYFTQVVRDWAQMRWQPNAELAAAMRVEAAAKQNSEAGRARALETNRSWNMRPGQSLLAVNDRLMLARKPGGARRGRPPKDAPVRRLPGEVSGTGG